MADYTHLLQTANAKLVQTPSTAAAKPQPVG